MFVNLLRSSEADPIHAPLVSKNILDFGFRIRGLWLDLDQTLEVFLYLLPGL